MTGLLGSSSVILGKTRSPEASPLLSKENCHFCDVRRDVPANSCSRFSSISPTSQKSENTVPRSAVAKSIQRSHHRSAQQLSPRETTGLGVCSSTARALSFASSDVAMSCCAWWKGLSVGQDAGEESSVSGRDNSYPNHCALHPGSPLLLHSCLKNQSFGPGPSGPASPATAGVLLEKSKKSKGQSENF